MKNMIKKKITFELERIIPEEDRFVVMRGEQKMLGFLFIAVAIAIILGFWVLIEQPVR